jgi:hypothetical protein
LLFQIGDSIFGYFCHRIILSLLRLEVVIG